MNEDNKKIIASGIADYDDEIKEGYIEWIQVSKDYKGKGLGKAIVYELLSRLKDRAKFVTVSGNLNNKSNPLRLYENCGFKSKVLWYVLTLKNDL